MKKFKLFLSLLMLVCFSVGTVWAEDPTVLFHETFGDNSGSARVWNDSYADQSGVAAVYASIDSYEISNAKQSKNTMGSTKSGLTQTTKGTDAYIIIGPLSVANYTTLGVTYQWNAASIKETYTTKLEYKTSADGSYTEVSGTGAGATKYVKREYSLPSAAQVATLYLKITWNTSNTSALIDEVELTGVKGGGPEPECTNTVTVAKGEATNGTFKLSDESVCGDGEGGEVFVTNIEPAAGYVFDKITATNGTVDTEKNKVTGITANTTITVSFKEIEKYTVSFDTGDGNGSVAPETEAVGGQGITLPDGPSSICSEAWTFAGWCETSVGTETTVRPTLLAAGSTYSPSDNTKLYAVYKRSEAGTGAWFNLSIEVSEVTYYVGAKGSGSFLLAVSSVDEAVAFKYEDGYLYYDNNGTNMYISSAKNNTTLTVATAQPTVTWTESGTTAVSYQSSGEGNRYLGINTGVSPIRFAPYTDSETYPHNLTKEAAGTTYYLSALNCCSGHNVAIADGIENGKVTADKSSACEGATVTLTAEPSENYKLDSWNVYKTGDESTKVPVSENQFTMPAYDVTVSATFARDKYTIAVDPSIENGTVEVKESVTAASAGTEITLIAHPEDTYALAEWKVTTATGAVEVNDNKFIMPAADVTVSAVFARDLYKITISSEIKHGSASADPTAAKAGDEIKLTASPDPHYKFVSWEVRKATDGAEVDVENNKFTMPESDVTVTAEFQAIKSSVTISTPVGGSLSVLNGATPVASGNKVNGGTLLTVTATPDEAAHYIGGVIKVVKTSDESDVTSEVLSGNTLTMPDYAITISATFTPTYAINIVAEGGNVVLDYDKAGAAEGYAKAGTEILATATADGAHDFKVLALSENVTVKDVDENVAMFTMPEGEVTITATFAEKTTPTISVDEVALDFGAVEYKAALESKTFHVSGVALSGKLTISCENEAFDVSPKEIDVDGTLAETAVTVTPKTTKCDEFNGTITISGGGALENKEVLVALKVNKLSADLAWDKSEFTANIGEENTFPTLNNPRNVEVTYKSSDEEIATIDNEGKITLKKAGQTFIIANFAGNDTVNAVAEDAISYELTVTQKYTAKWYVNGAKVAEQKAAVGDDLNAFPTDFSAATDCSDLAYMGWLTAPLSEASATAPTGLITETVGLKMPEGGINYYAVFAELSEEAPEENKYSHAIEEKTWEKEGVQTLSDVAWTLATDGSYYGYDGTKGQQIGSGSSPAKSLTLSTSGIAGTISKVTIYTSGAKSIAATVAVSVNGADYICDEATSKSISDSNTGYTFTGDKKGEIKISWAQTSSKALYFKQIEVTTVEYKYVNYVTTCPKVPRVTLSSDVVEHGSISFAVNGKAVTNVRTDGETGATVDVVAEPATGYELTKVELSGVEGASYEAGVISIPKDKEGALTATATFSKINYKVTMAQWPTDAGATLNENITNAHYGEEVVISTNEPAGYIFSGWSIYNEDDTELKTDIASEIFTGDYAQYEYKKEAKFLMPNKNIFAEADFHEIHDVAWALENTPSSGSSDVVYVKGIISQIDSYKDNAITYWISDNGQHVTGTVLEVYKGKGVDNADFTAKENLSLGDEVVVRGKLKNYSGTKEFDKDNYLYSRTAAEVTSVVIEGDASIKEYEYGDDFKFDGLSAKAYYNTGYQAVVEQPEWSAEPAKVTANGNVTVKATYQGKSDQKIIAVELLTHELTFNANPDHGTLVVKYNDNPVATDDHFLKGDKLTVEATPASAEYKLATLTANGADIKVTKEYIVGTEDVEIVATFVEKAEAPISWSVEAATAYTKGKSYTLPTLSNDKNLTVAYSSLTPAVAEIAANGEITIKSAGTTTITASFAGNDDYKAAEKSYNLTVTAPASVAITGDAAKTSYSENEDFDFTGLKLTVTYDNNETWDAPAAEVEWTATPAKMTLGLEKVSVSAKWNEMNAAAVEVNVNVSDKQAANISWDPTSAIAYTIGKEYELPTLKNEGQLAVSYKSTNEAVATIDADGKVTIKAEGQTAITAIFAGNDSYRLTEVAYTLTVYAPVSIAISGECENTEYDKNAEFSYAGLIATVTYGDDSKLDVTEQDIWSNNLAEGKVAEAGDVTVTVSWNGLEDTKVVAVTVKEDPALGIDNAEVEMKAQKIMINGIIYIQRGDKLFNAQGQVVR